MNDADRFKLLYGPYRPPRCRLGKRVRCVIRGECIVRGISDAPVPWPTTRWHGSNRPSVIVFGSLVKAIRRESEIAVAHHWGVSPFTVWTWRKALGVGATTAGTSRLRRDHFNEPWAEEAKAKACAKARDPQRRAKIAAARRGKPRPPHVIEAMRRGRTGKPHSAETRRKMSEAHRFRGRRPRAAGRPWTEQEEELLGTMPDEEVARMTGRTVSAVAKWRRRLHVSVYEKKGRRP